MAHGLSCSTACGIFPDQGLNPCPLHWQADSFFFFFNLLFCVFILFLFNFLILLFIHQVLISLRHQGSPIVLAFLSVLFPVFVCVYKYINIVY